MEEQIFLTVPETAKILRLKRSTAYEYVWQGIIPTSWGGSSASSRI